MEKHKNHNDLDKPDPATLHTTDPQEHMNGPVSSLVQDLRKMVETEKPDNNEKDRKKTEQD